MKQKYQSEYNSTIIAEEENIEKNTRKSVISLPIINEYVNRQYKNLEKNIRLSVNKRIKEVSEEILVIHHYLEKYENRELFNQVQECVRTVKRNYEQSVRDQKWTNNLMHIMGSVEKIKNIQQSLALHDDYILGSGGYGVIIKKSRIDFSNVMKISFGMRSKPLDNSMPYIYHDPIDEQEMPFEYCVGLHSPTTHILKPLLNSFQPIELPITAFRNAFQTRRGILTFYNPVNTAKVDISFSSKKIIEPVVPMFEMPLCHKVRWNEDGFDIKPHKQFVDLLRALDDVHKSGIALMDISPNNIMNCNGEFKFIDLGFAELYKHADMPIIMFGVEFYRSPWAHIASELEIEEHQELHLGRKLFLETIASDYWSLAFTFGSKLCSLGKHAEFKTIIDDIIESKSSKYGGYSTLSVAEINEFLQSHLELMFSQLRINHNPSSKKRALCTKTLQEMLKSILHVNPVVRMKNVEKMLSTY